MSTFMPSLSGKEIVRHVEIGKLTYFIKGLVSCHDKIYRKLYDATLFNVAEFCQSMPYAESDFNESYGFLLRQLSLTFATLKIRRGILLPHLTGAETIAAEEAQWTYAIFSASLVKNLYQLQHNREVAQYQMNRDFASIWSPMTGSLYNTTFYYTMRYANPTSTTPIDVFMAAISQHIFPELAISWLSTNDVLYKQWWDVILHQPTSDNDIEGVIQLAADKLRIDL